MKHHSSRIEFRASGIHGLGGFARRQLRAGERIIEYCGERISKEQSAERCAAGNHFIFGLDADYDLDGAVETNPARWINHSCAPNAEAHLIRGSVWIVAARDIPAAEEITFDYGYDLENYREHPCCCGAIGCPGYMVAEVFRGAVLRQEEVRAAAAG